MRLPLLAALLLATLPALSQPLPHPAAAVPEALRGSW